MQGKSTKSTKILKKQIDSRISKLIKMINQTSTSSINSSRIMADYSTQTVDDFYQHHHDNYIGKTVIPHKDRFQTTRLNTQQSNHSYDDKIRENQSRRQTHNISDWNININQSLQQKANQLSFQLTNNKQTQQLTFQKTNPHSNRSISTQRGLKQKKRKSSVINPKLIPQNRQKTDKDSLISIKKQIQKLYEKSREQGDSYKPRETLINKLSSKYQKYRQNNVNK